MRNATLFVGAVLGLAGMSRAATVVSYTATASPGANPDGTDANGTPTDVWQETVTQGTSGGAGSYFSGWYANGWQLYSYPDATGGLVDETHTFTGGSVGIGQTVSISFGNSAVQAGDAVGFSLVGTTAPISFTFTGGDTSGHYRYADSGGTNQDSGLTFEYQTAIPISMTFTTATTYTATAGTVSWTGTYAGAVTGIDVFNHAGGNGSDVGFDSLAVSGTTAVPEPVGLSFLGLAGFATLARRRR